jgi:kumamolisin
MHPTLYGTGTATASREGFRDITLGNNGGFVAKAGWDACTGLGVPEGTGLLTLFT